ncbi:MAG TPA: acyl carrier protein [Polyangiaceae bacterium]|nr:acyl carrier protein [Polyangiaceae bacterium]
MDTENRIRAFVVDNFLFGKGGDRLSSRDSLIAQGVIDSTGVLELVSFVELTFGILVQDADLTPDNFDSIASLTRFVERKLPVEGSGDAPDSRAA